LLNVAFLGLWWLTVSLIGINIPAFLPIIVYVQWLLVAVVQAFVFSLLVAIFIKMADEWESVIADEEHYQHHHRQHQTILK
jgi:F0F1-type ATP synthase membrane subunit a